MIPTVGWEEVQQSVREKIGRRAYEAWIGPLEGRVDRDELVIFCPDLFTRNYIQQRFGPLIEGSATQVRAISYEICRAADAIEPQPKPTSSGRNRQNMPDSGGKRPPVRRAELRFDSFVSGQCNALALEAARAIATGRVGALSPLVLVGSTGVGKTHLCQSICAETPSVAYRSSEEFTSEVTTAMRSRDASAMASVRQRYRRAHNVLILEDIQFLEGKKATQTELFHTVDHLMRHGKAVVVTADRPPSELEIDGKLVTRLQSGMIVRIGSADPGMRTEILRAKAAGGGVRLSEECLRILAERPARSVGDLLAGLNQVVARATLLQCGITPELVRATLADVGMPGPSRTIEEIAEVVARAYSVTTADLRSRSRKRKVVRPRHLAMYICRKYTDASLAEIGSAFERDHTTVLHALQSVERQTVEKPQLRYELDALASRFGAPSASP